MDAPALFRLLGDDVRLRILRLLDAERLNVSELTGILGIAQSGVSRHLGLLKDAKLVEERREGAFVFFRLAPSLTSGLNGFGGLWPVLTTAFASTAATPVGRADDVRLEEIRRLRQENFEEHAEPGSAGRQLVPGRSWAAWARALAHLLPRLVVADIGCGEGYLTVEAARFAERVIAVDRSAPMLQRGRELAKRRRVTNIRWKRGEIEALPLEDAAVDLALLSQALHHAGEPARAIAEAVRVTKPGGRLLLLDLRRHDQQWVSDTLGDRWLGFEDSELARLLSTAGLDDVRVTVGSRRARDPFTVLVASGTKAGLKAASNTSHAKHD
jgi:ArsR family transcriptional regulator